MSILRRTCVGCGRGNDLLCRQCRSGLAPPPNTRIRGVGRVDALFAYQGVGADLVRALKFRNARSLLTEVADGLAAVVEARFRDTAAVTWLPTSPSRRHERGFDQAELLARAVGRRLDRPVISVFRRLPGPPQTGRSWDERAVNVAFTVRAGAAGRAARATGRLIVVDDVCTTGATMRAAHDSLPSVLAAGSGWFALARTP